MSKTGAYDYSITASSNSDFDGTDSSGATGKVKDGDNYARSIASHVKGVLNDLGGINTVAGTGDAITITLSAAPAALVDGYRLTFNASAANTTNTTLTVTPNGGASFGSKKVLKWSGGVETALSAGDIPAANALVEVVYDTARDTAAGAWMLLGTSVAATTSAFGTVKLATSANVLAPPVGSTLVPTIPDLYFPTGHLFGATLSNGTDATNDINVAAFTCRDSTDTANFASTVQLVKQLDVAWSVNVTPGTPAGGLDQGSIANATYHVHAIKRVDTNVVDAIFSLSHDKSATVTMTIASPAVVTMGVAGNGHGLVAGSPIKFATTGALPTGVTAGTQYYVISAGLTETAFEFSASNGGAAVNSSGSQSGTHTCLPGPQLPTSYTLFRRIGSVVRTGGALKAFMQIGDTFEWASPVVDIDATNPPATAVTRTLSVPTGIRAEVILSAAFHCATNNNGLYISDLSQTDLAVQDAATAAVTNMFDTFSFSASTGGWVGGMVKRVFTNTSGQVRSRVTQAGAANHLGIITHGWVDTRGRTA